jgi:hypothetical protein
MSRSWTSLWAAASLYIQTKSRYELGHSKHHRTQETRQLMRKPRVHLAWDAAEQWRCRLSVHSQGVS